MNKLVKLIAGLGPDVKALLTVAAGAVIALVLVTVTVIILSKTLMP